MKKLQTVTGRAMSLLVTVLMTCTMLVGTPFRNVTAAQAAEAAVVKPAFTAEEINGTYYLKNKGNSKYLYALGTASKSEVALGAKQTTAAYKMKITPVTAGNAQKGCYITPTSGSVVLNPFSDTPTNGTVVNLYTKNTDGTQYWIFEPVTGGYILHNSYNTNLVLNSTGTGVTVATKANTNAQIWVLESTAVTLSSISITKKPAKLTYNAGESLNTSGLTLKLTYSDGSTKTVTSGFTATADLSTAGTKTVKVSYTAGNVTKTASFTVTVKAVLNGITLTQLPGKTAYSAGEALDTTGMQVTASYTGAADKDVTDAVTVACDLSQAGTKTAIVSYTENGVTKTATYTVTVDAVLSGIRITQLPGKTVYSVGETLDTTGLQVTASYTGAADRDVTDAVTVSACDLSQAGTKTVTVSYTEDGVTKTATFTVTVHAVLTGIKVTQKPGKTAYSAGETLDTTGMKITASYNGAADRDVTDAVTVTCNLSTAGTKTVTVSYTENGVTKTATFKVTVSAVLSGIRITQMPDKTAYSAGETLDTTGMQITASYTGAADRDVTASVTTAYDFSQAGTKTVTVSYTENGVTKTATFKVTVSAVLSGIRVTQKPGKTVYSAGETLDTAGMKITASYTGAADKDVTASVTVESDLSQAGTKAVTVSYTENGVTKTASFNVTVNAVLTGIKITQLPDKTEYTVGETLDPAGMKVIASYRGAADKNVTASVTTAYDFSEPGEAAVTVTFGEYTAKFKVNVNEAPDVHFRGEGTEENPFLIACKADLEAMRDLINDTDTSEDYNQAYYKQTADIDLAGESWMPIGKRMKGTEDWGYGFFNGSYDGDHHRIVGLNVVSTTKYSGLFGSVGGYGVIKNLHVEGSVRSSRDCTGGIAGEINNTVISNCSFIGNIKSDSYIAGGLVGNFWQGGTLTNCYHIGTVEGSRTIGGLAGYVCSGEESYAGDMIFENCYHVGEVDGYSKIGSAFGEVLIGSAYPAVMTVTNVYARTGDASAAQTGSGFSGSVTVVTDSELKQSAEALGDAYLNDPDMLNNGYPMFLWEMQAVAGGRITAQPQNLTTPLGSTAKFSVTAEGEGLTYQWQYNNGSGWKDSGMTGNKTATLSVAATEARNGQQYRCVITNSYGLAVVSDAAVLTVTPKITTQPAGKSAAIGDTAAFTVAAEGTGLTYQWQYYNTTVFKWIDSGMTGNKTATLSVEATPARNGQKYRCIVTSSLGNSTVSGEAALTVIPKITTQPANMSGAVGDTVKFTVAAEGTDLFYQWQFYDKSVSRWKDSGMTGSQTATLSVEATLARNGQKYRCIVTNSFGNNTISDAAALTVTPKITTQPVNKSGAVGDTVKFTVAAEGTDLSYQWQYYDKSHSKWKDSGMTGNQTAALSVPVTAARDGQQYRCIVSSAIGTSAISDAATLTVSAALSITAQPTGQSGAIDSTVTFTVKASGTSLTYQWQYYNTTTAKWTDSGMTGAKTAALNVPVTAARDGQKYRCVITASGSSVTSDAVKLTVQAAITTQPANKTASAGTNAKFTVAASGAGTLTYQWQYYDKSVSRWKDSGMTGNNTSALTVAATAARNGQQYRCIVTSSNGTSVTSDAATLTVK